MLDSQRATGAIRSLFNRTDLQRIFSWKILHLDGVRLCTGRSISVKRHGRKAQCTSDRLEVAVAREHLGLLSNYASVRGWQRRSFDSGPLGWVDQDGVYRVTYELIAEPGVWDLYDGVPVSADRVVAHRGQMGSDSTRMASGCVWFGLIFFEDSMCRGVRQSLYRAQASILNSRFVWLSPSLGLVEPTGQGLASAAKSESAGARVSHPGAESGWLA